MQLVIIGFERPGKDGTFISPDFKRLILDKKVDEISLLNPAALNTSALEEELKQIVGEDCIKNYDLPPLATDQLLIKDLKNQPWELMKSVLRIINQPGNCMFAIGRGTALHQHILWLVAHISGSSIIELSSHELSIKSANLAKKENFNEIGKKTLGAFPTLYINEILNKNQIYSSNYCNYPPPC